MDVKHMKELLTAQAIMKRWNEAWDDWEVRIREQATPDGELSGYTAYDEESAALLQKHIGTSTWTVAQHDQRILAPLYEAGFCIANMTETYDEEIQETLQL